MIRWFEVQVLALALLTPSCGDSSSTERSPTEVLLLPPSLESAKRVLWVSAHPDDESVIAPLLGHLCVENGSNCTILSLTRGEGGSCLLDSCPPDLGTFRAGELTDAAALLGANVIQWQLPNAAASTAEEALTNFVSNEGDLETLLRKLTAVIEQVAPDALLSFDPRSGVTCHPDHRATGALVIEAAKAVALNPKPTSWLLESKYQLASPTATEGSSDWIGLSPVADVSELVTFGAAAKTADGRDYWSYLLGDLMAQPSQFSTQRIAQFESAPPANRAVHWLMLDDAEAQSAALSVCP